MTRYYMIFITLFSFNTVFASNSAWTFDKRTDDMTDKLTCRIQPNIAQWNKALEASNTYFPLIMVDLEKIQLVGFTKGSHAYVSLAEDMHMIRIDKNDTYSVYAFVFKREKEYMSLINEMIAGNIVKVRTESAVYGTETYGFSLLGFTQALNQMRNDKACGP